MIEREEVWCDVCCDWFVVTMEQIQADCPGCEAPFKLTAE